jgi:hypothetical protein
MLGSYHRLMRRTSCLKIFLAALALTLTIPLPASSQEVALPSIHSLTDAATEGVVSITHAYSSVNPFNSDSTLVLVEKSGGSVQVRDLSGKIVRDNLSRFGVLPTSDAVWSRTDPHLFYYHTTPGNELRSYNTARDTATTLATFDEYETISFGSGEGDISDDGDHIAVIGDKKYGFIYTLSTTKKTSRVDLSRYGVPDSFDMTNGNGAVLLTYDPAGIFVFDAAMQFKGKKAAFGGHSDRASAEGKSFIIVANAADPAPLGNCPNGVVSVDLESGTQKCLAHFDWSLALHISCNNTNQGWCLVSTYAPGNPASRVAYANALVRVNLDGSAPTLLGTTSSSNADYTRFPRAAISTDGTSILFDSDMRSSAVNTYLAALDHSSAPAAPVPPVPSPTLLSTPIPKSLRLIPERYGLSDGALVSQGIPDPDIFIINTYGYKRLFLNPIIFNFYGHLGGFGNVRPISAPTRDAFETSLLFRNCEVASPKVYALEVTGEDTGTLHWLNIDGDAAASHDPEFFKKIFCINTNEFSWYALGSTYSSLAMLRPYVR